MSSLNFIGGEKGGVGKSLVSRLLAQYFIDHDLPFVGFDTDRSHGSLLRFYADYASPALVDNFEALDAIVETALAEQFNVSRGPLREAMRQLIEEGLLVTVPYTGTHVTPLSTADVREIYSMRITLERFAFEQAWPRRDAAFKRELQRRNDVLLAAIDAGDDSASIQAELDLHGFVFEASGHQLLQRTWASLRGRLQLYWAAHHRAHGIRGPRRDSHDDYVRIALGKSLPAMLEEVSKHMRRGAEQTESAG